jgi:membrane associated rhomboid family serine protease
MNSQKILIEFMGGGACWDGDTCDMQSSYLTFPQKLDSFLGLSCSEINAGQGDAQINMLCAKNVGGVDFTSYNSIVVPYCTQDVFVGSNTMDYDSGRTVHHHGGSNTMAVIEWVKDNFSNPSHIVLTGCSAGGTALPIAYDLLNMHYNHWSRSTPGMRSVQLSVVADSAVYLTPTYFLQNALPNWDPEPMMKKIRFPYSKYKEDEDYSTLVWNHALKRGPKSDQWGFVTHNNDPVSQMYYKYMGGLYANDDDANNDDANNDDANGRMLEEDVAEAWWNSLSSSLQTVQQKHKNVDTYIMDGEGHCTFGWYYALQDEGFEDWVTSIIQEKVIFGRTSPSVGIFVAALVVSVLLGLGAKHSRGHKEMGVDDGVLISSSSSQDTSQIQPLSNNKKRFQKFVSRLSAKLHQFQDYPITFGYFVLVTIYFWTMLLANGFAHPIDNPSLGPSAVTLSRYGINNPTMVIYQSQLFRLITSGVVCSGIITYFMVVWSLVKHISTLESALGNTKQFAVLSSTILLGSNLIYAIFANGASCSSIALILGLNSLSIVTGRRVGIEESPLPRPICFSVTLFIIVALLLPFNSWLMNLGGILTGAFVGLMGLEKAEDADLSSSDIRSKDSKRYSYRQLPFKALYSVFALALVLLIFRIRRPNKLYSSPFLTGCELANVELSADIVGSFGGDGQRLLKEDEGNDDDYADGYSYCGEFCVPHLAARPLVWGASTYSGYTVSTGQCQDKGYDTHIADKTFTKATYSVDVEVYTIYENDDDAE